MVLNVGGKREGKLPELSASSTMKLRHLSIITLASKSRLISYSTMADFLEMRNVRELEDLIIEAFYADIIKGKLDQLNNQLQIEFAIGRDVTDDQIDAIISCLDNW
jgi:COP9 signalosome complex subunit 7